LSAFPFRGANRNMVSFFTISFWVSVVGIAALLGYQRVSFFRKGFGFTHARGRRSLSEYAKEFLRLFEGHRAASFSRKTCRLCVRAMKEYGLRMRAAGAKKYREVLLKLEGRRGPERKNASSFFIKTISDHRRRARSEKR